MQWEELGLKTRSAFPSIYWGPGFQEDQMHQGHLCAQKKLEWNYNNRRSRIKKDIIPSFTTVGVFHEESRPTPSYSQRVVRTMWFH